MLKTACDSLKNQRRWFVRCSSIFKAFWKIELRQSKH